MPCSWALQVEFIQLSLSQEVNIKLIFLNRCLKTESRKNKKVKVASFLSFWLQETNKVLYFELSAAGFRTSHLKKKPD